MLIETIVRLSLQFEFHIDVNKTFRREHRYEIRTIRPYFT